MNDNAVSAQGGSAGHPSAIVGLLAAAHRQHYEAAELAACAATYAFHLTRNHPFVDGNKRVGAAVAEIFVRLNGARLDATDDEIVELFFSIAAGNISRDEVEQLFARWVRISP
jgi:death-on-curing protein